MSRCLLPRRVLRVSGDDAGAFLDSILTRDATDAAPAAPVYAALLSPQGKLQADLFIHRDADGSFRLDIAADRFTEVSNRLTLMRLRRKAIVEPADDLHVVADLDPGAGPPDPRAPDGALGARLISENADADTPFAAYEARRTRAGYPDPATDAAPEEVFGLEALLEELHGVDFHKGCFVGQENVSRMKRRATTRRKFCRIAFEGPPPPRGTPVTAGDVTLGDVRSGVDGAAIALLRLDRALGAPAPLFAGQIEVRLDPPSFLILPSPGDD